MTNRDNHIQVSFANYEDLTTRLVLLPRIEDEGIGAVVASFEPDSLVVPSSSPPSANHSINEIPAVVRNSSNDNSDECRDDETKKGSLSDAKATQPSKNLLVGGILVGPHNSKENWKNTDFATVLAALRGQTGPIVLELEIPPTNDSGTVGGKEHYENEMRLEKNSSTTKAVQEDDVVADMQSVSSDSDLSENSRDKDQDQNEQENTRTAIGTSESTTAAAPISSTLASATVAAAAAAATTETSDDINGNDSKGNNNNTMARWSAWGSRMRAQAQQAAETASLVAAQSYQVAAASRAAAAQKAADAAKQLQQQVSDEEEEEPPCCGLHVQTSLGAFLPLSNPNDNKQGRSIMSSTSVTATSLTSPRSRQSPLNLTTSSVLYVRKSAVESCPARGYTYQWYKGLPESKNRSGSSLGEDWMLLPGANSAAFQPSTTEVGYKLLCLVTIDPSVNTSLMDSDSDSDSEDDDSRADTKSKKPRTMRCVTPDVVAADLSLFNGTRQALVRGQGAHFGGLVGQGKAQGRTFSIRVEMGSPSEPSSRKGAHGQNSVCSCVKIDQVSGETAEPLHSEPFYNVSAQSNHAMSKHVALHFRATDLVNSASLLSALVTDDGLLELVAPNRFARESLLLAIGIANFKEEPSRLDATAILFSSGDDEAATEEDESESASEEENGSSSDDEALTSSSASATPSVQSVAVESLAGDLESVTSATASGAPSVQIVAVENTAGHSKQNESRIPKIDELPGTKSELQKIVDDEQSVSSVGDTSTVVSSTSTMLVEVTSVATAMHQTPQKVRDLLGPTDRELELEKELEFLRSKLTKKDKALSEMQRQIAHSDSALQQANRQSAKLQQQLHKSEEDIKSTQRLQKAAERMVDEHVSTMKKLKEDQAVRVSKLNLQIERQAKIIADLEKTVKSHSNEKAVLTAAVEARDSKLVKMAELQASHKELSSRVTQQDQWKNELDESLQRYQELKSDWQKTSEEKVECENELQSVKMKIESLLAESERSKQMSAKWQEELKNVETKNQKLKSERNSYKQKADSLTREISRICKNGKTLSDIEKILADDEARQEEVALLRKQKRKAMEECHIYRRSFEQTRAAQNLMHHAKASPKNKKEDNNFALLLERNVELERLVSELSEYVNAKEMQLETMKQVNSTLNQEVHYLALATMKKDEV